MMMISAGIPELYDETNIKFVIDRLSLKMDKLQAEEKMRKHIEETYQIHLLKKE